MRSVLDAWRRIGVEEDGQGAAEGRGDDNSAAIDDTAALVRRVAAAAALAVLLRRPFDGAAASGAARCALEEQEAMPASIEEQLWRCRVEESEVEFFFWNERSESGRAPTTEV